MIYKIMELSLPDLALRAALISAEMDSLGTSHSDSNERQSLMRCLVQVQAAQILRRIMLMR
ncbi:MAG: hypothetical protein K2W93_09125 [Burkholderiaceae bacterium]|nr:hypothetical protein [Burkholderiaceae bacterium]